MDNATAGDGFGMYVYPNPAQNQVTVMFDSPSSTAYNLSMFDFTGRVVLSNNGSSVEGSNKIELPLQDIALGIYNLRLTIGHESSSMRVIVK